MCIAPILIKNPYKDRGSTLEHKGQKVRLNIGGNFDYLHDTISQYIQVPCGKCSQCLSMRQGFLNQRVQMESLRSELFYFTLTYNSKGLPISDHPLYRIPYPRYEDIQNLFKSVRKILPHKLRMYVVSEYGSKKFRPHFHGFLAVSREDIKKYYRGSYLYCEKVLFRVILQHWRRNISSSHKHPIYIPLLDFIVRGKKRTYDLHWVQPIMNHDNDVSFYVSKYILKYQPRIEKLLSKIKLDSRLTEDETKRLISLFKPRSVMSKDFGSYKLPYVQSKIKQGLSSCLDFPSFFDLHTGKSMLLSPYYRKRFVTLDMKFDKYWKYLHEVQFLDVPQTLDSYNPELLGEDIIQDINRSRFRAIQQDRHLSRVRSRLSKI